MEPSSLVYNPDPIVREQIARRFHYPEITQERAQRLSNLRITFGHMAKIVIEASPPGYEQNQVLNKLEEASFWLHEALVRNE